jgi:hypothetical protein
MVFQAPPGGQSFWARLGNFATQIGQNLWVNLRNFAIHVRNLSGQLLNGSDDPPPDFEKSVVSVLATFTVFTGYTINNFMTDFNLKSLPINNLSGWRFWAFFAFVSLMLRYIFGSAIHLNATYVGKTKYVNDAAAGGWIPKKEAPKSRSVFFLFKDFLFLVVFGLLAVHLLGAVGNFKSFVHRTMWFVGAGFAWSLTDYYVRRAWCLYTVESAQKDSPTLRRVDFSFLVLFIVLALGVGWAANQVLSEGKDIELFIVSFVLLIVLGFAFSLANLAAAPAYNPPEAPDGEWPGAFWRLWVWLDGLQFLAAWLIARAIVDLNDSANMDYMSKILAALFIAFLLFDLGAMIRAVQLKWK